MLVKVDRMSMAHGLEVRVPFLDPDLVDFCWRLPDKMKVCGSKLKFLLREAIKDTYPKELQQQPKSGFNLDYDTFPGTEVTFNNTFCFYAHGNIFRDDWFRFCFFNNRFIRFIKHNK